MSVPAAYRYDWALFTDWCAAFDLDPLPAQPVTLARFLDAHPATDLTQIRRVTVVNTMHRRAGLTTPGRAQAIRDLLNPPAPDTRRTAEQRAVTAETVLRNLPTSGWPSGLFGRRDAMIIVLSCYAELPHTAISTLQRSDVTFQHGAVHIGAGFDIWLTPRPDPRTCPVAIYLRWARLQAFHDRAPSNKSVGPALAKTQPVTSDTVTNHRPPPEITEKNDGPVITPFDMHGSFALRRHDRRGVNPKDITRIVSAHLSGTARIRATTDPKHIQPADEPDTAAPQPTLDVLTPQLSATELNERYEAAIARRHRDADEMRALDDKFRDIDARTEALLKHTEQLLAQMNTAPGKS